MLDFQAILQEIEIEIQPYLAQGKIASYIPELSLVEPTSFAMSLMTVDGQSYHVGAHHKRFSIQSISKLFTLTMAISLVDEKIWERIGKEPSGSPFNSLVQLEYENGIPRNPFINAGALVVTDIILNGLKDAQKSVLNFIRMLAEKEDINFDFSVAKPNAMNALMLTCGTYDAVGEFAYRVGLPAKSGVGEGILACLPGKFSICVWSPRLSEKGNSVAGAKALELFTTKTKMSIF